MVAQEATWSADSGGETRPAKVASVFPVQHGALSLVHRFDHVAAALNKARRQADKTGEPRADQGPMPFHYWQ